jgi:hypothetical protein
VILKTRPATIYNLISRNSIEQHIAAGGRTGSPDANAAGPPGAGQKSGADLNVKDQKIEVDPQTGEVVMRFKVK